MGELERRLRSAAVANFRVARPSSQRRLAMKTGAQIVVVWGFALGLLPAVATRVDARLHLPQCGQMRFDPCQSLLFTLLRIDVLLPFPSGSENAFAPTSGPQGNHTSH